MDDKPVVTKDGVSVARALNMIHANHRVKQPLLNIGAKILIDAAEKANDNSGDGTTSCLVIAYSIMHAA